MKSITVLVPVYCHANWLETALLSIINQSCFSDVSVIIGDDCSTDNSVDIARKIAGKHDNIKILTNSKNLGILGNYKSLIEHVETEFVTILEGDDFWCSPEKLNRQYEYMRANPDVNGSFVEYFLYLEDTGASHTAPHWASGRYRKLSTLDLLATNPSASFSTCMYKTAVFRRCFSRVKNIKAADWITNILVSEDSYMGFIPGPAAVYRLHSNGSWTGLSSHEKKSLLSESLQAAMECLPASYLPYLRERSNFIAAGVS